MIYVSKDYQVSHKNGYYQVYAYLIAETGKQKGEKILSYMKTYPCIFTAHDKLKDLGIDGSKALNALGLAKDLYIRAVSDSCIKAIAKRKLDKAKSK